MFGLLIDDAVNGDFGGTHIGHGISSHGDGEALLGGRAVLCGVGDAIDIALVGLDGNLARGLARLPFPVAGIFRSLWQLWHEGDVLAVGRDGACLFYLIGIFQAAEVGLVLIGHAFIDNVTAERRDGL